MTDDSLLVDGAAFDPVQGTWRPIAPVPTPITWAASAVLGDDVYLWSTWRAPTLLRYEIAENRWETLEIPPGVGPSHTMVRLDDRLLFYAGSDEQGEVSDVLFDPESGTVEELPPDPLSPSFGRAVVIVDGDIVLFAHDLVPNPGSEEPSLVRAARYRPAARTWLTLATSESLATSPLFVDGGHVVVPVLGAADGGEVNNWGRAYPYGAVYDAVGDSWSPLPATEADSSAGVVGNEGALYLSTSGVVLDSRSGRWIDLPAIADDAHVTTQRSVITAGSRAFVFGGARWDGSEGELLDDAWLWEPPGEVGSTTAPTGGTALGEDRVCGDPGSESDLTDEPRHGNDVERWTNADGCPVHIHVLMTNRPGPTFHCQGWPPDLVMGTPLGSRTDESEPRVYIRDPDGYFGDAALQEGFAAHLDPPPSAIDTGYRSGEIALWMDPNDDRFVYLVGATATERWPKATQLFGCA